MESLTPQLLEVSQLLASGMTYAQVAQTTNVPKSTIGRWAKLPQVQAQIELLRSEAIEAHREISHEAARANAGDLQQKLAQSLRRQEALIVTGYNIASGYLDLTQKMLNKVAEIFTSDRPIESHEKLLITSVPSYLRAATDMIRSVSDTEDKCYAVEEISKRLDAWEKHWSETEGN
jgi:predicted metal-dependent hydrolase